jgi:hypothetical protein
MKKLMKKQRGIAVITLVLLVITLLIVIGAMVQSSRTTASSTSDQTAKVMAAAVIDQSNMLRVGFDLMVAKGTSLDSITFNATQATVGIGPGLFNLADGTAVPQIPPSGATTDPTTRWAYTRGGLTHASVAMVTLGGIKNKTAMVFNTNPLSYGLILPNVKDTVCKQLNAALLGYDPNSPIPLVKAASPAITKYTGTEPNQQAIANIDTAPGGLVEGTGFDISDLDGGTTSTGAPAFSQSGNQVMDSAGHAVMIFTGTGVCVKPGTGGAVQSTALDNNVFVSIIKFM